MGLPHVERRAGYTRIEGANKAGIQMTIDWRIYYEQELCLLRARERGVIGIWYTRAEEFSGNFPSARKTQCQGP